MGTHDDRADTRSGLAYAFLDLVERYRPPAIVLENVPGLLSSNAGRDFYALQRRLAELGYVGAYRVLDARHFGVPQRRRRVFIVALDARRGATADDAAEVLSVGSRCPRHPATGGEAGEGAAAGADDGVAPTLLNPGDGSRSTDLNNPLTIVADTVRSHPRPGSNSNGSLAIVGPSPDAGRVRATDGLAGRLDDRAGVDIAPTLTAPDTRHRVVDGKRQDGSRLDRIPQVVVNALDQRRGGADDNEAQAGHLIATLMVGGRSQGAGSSYDNTPWGLYPATISADDDLLPNGLDSHRYRCCGNGVVADVAEWIGARLAAWAEARA